MISDNFDSSSAESVNRTETLFGDHLVQVANARTITDRNGQRGFFLDCIVLEGPTTPGTEFSYVWYPDQKADFKAKKEGELKRNVGACFGYDAAGSTANVKSAVIGATFVDTKATPGAHSPLRGRVVRMTAEKYFSKRKSRDIPIYNFRPYLVDGAPVDRPLTNAIQAAPAAAAPAIVTPAPAPVVTTPQPFPPVGWAPHPDASHAAQGWYYEVATGQPKHERDLRQSA